MIQHTAAFQASSHQQQTMRLTQLSAVILGIAIYLILATTSITGINDPIDPTDVTGDGITDIPDKDNDDLTIDVEYSEEEDDEIEDDEYDDNDDEWDDDDYDDYEPNEEEDDEDNDGGYDKRDVNMDDADIDQLAELLGDDGITHDINKRQAASIIGGVKGGFVGPTGPPSIAPPGTINRPIRVSFDTSNNFDDETADDAVDAGLSFRSGSASDEDASDWSVVTSTGYEYQARRSELRSIFGTAQYSLAGAPADDDGETFTDTPVADEEVIRPPPGPPGPPDGPPPIRHANIGIRKRSVFPPDTRKRVRNPRRFPWSAIGRFDNGCTGFFIGPRHILTAGHCVYSKKTKKWSKKLNFRRGKNCGRYSGTRYIWRRAITVKGWKRWFWKSYDYAMVVVSRSSPVRLRYSYRRRMPKWTINIAGYPKDKPQMPHRCMWRSSCKIQRRYAKMLGYRCDTNKGMSGSPVYVYSKKSRKRVVYGIHAYGKSFLVNRNRCVRITKPRYKQFKRWISRY